MNRDSSRNVFGNRVVWTCVSTDLMVFGLVVSGFDTEGFFFSLICSRTGIIILLG